MAAMKIKLIANDGKTMEVDQDVAFKSKMVKEMCANLGVTESFEVDVTQANGKTLEKIVEYCTKYKDEEYVPKGEKDDQRIDLTKDHEDYLNVHDDFLLELLTGANFLDIPGLLDIICQKIANMIKGKNAAEIREIYGFEDDLTEEEKAEVKKKYEWLDL